MSHQFTPLNTLALLFLLSGVPHRGRHRWRGRPVLLLLRASDLQLPGLPRVERWEVERGYPGDEKSRSRGYSMERALREDDREGNEARDLSWP